MAAELQVSEDPAVVIVPPPNRGGRYQLEFRLPGESAVHPPSGCGHESPQALLWLIFMEAGREANREITEVICARCDPARFARAQAWAEALA